MTVVRPLARNVNRSQAEIVLHRGLFAAAWYIEPADMQDNFHVRMTFDHGELSLMSTQSKRQHEQLSAIYLEPSLIFGLWN